MAAVAADLGITLGLEVINRYETNVLNTAVQASGIGFIGYRVIGFTNVLNTVVQASGCLRTLC